MLRSKTMNLLVALMATLAACGGDGGTAAAPDAGPGPAPAPAPIPAPTPPAPLPPTTAADPTAQGLPLGATTSATIGAAGGELRSADGRLHLRVPPGAFDRDHVISMQAIQNLAPGAKGGAWRIQPEGLTAAQPMTLTLRPGADDTEGSSFELLNVATQGADGRWLAHTAPRRDAATGAIAVDTRHFSDWSLVAGAQLRPGRARVAVNQALDLELIDCPLLSGNPLQGTAVIGRCSTLPASAGTTSHWAANGTDGGSAVAGVVAATVAGGGRYTAPGTPPPGNPVAVSVDLTPAATPRQVQRLVSRVQVVSPDSCAWLHGTPALDYEAEMAYAFTASNTVGALAMQQSGLIRGRMQRVFDDDLAGVWQGTTTNGYVNLADRWTEGPRSGRLSGSGAPAIGTGERGNDYSGMQLTVDYRNCTYTLSVRMAVVAGTGEPNDVPVATTVGSFMRGDEPIFDVPALVGNLALPPRPEPTPAGAYAPGGVDAGRLFIDGYAQPGAAGQAHVRWAVLAP